MAEQTSTKEISHLFSLADKLHACREMKKEHKDAIKELDAEIDSLDRQLSDGMVEAECTKFSRGGKLFYLTSSLYASPLAGKSATLNDTLKKEGFGSLVKESVNPRTLSSFVKEQIAANDGNLPDWLAGIVNTYEKASVGIRKG